MPHVYTCTHISIVQVYTDNNRETGVYSISKEHYYIVLLMAPIPVTMVAPLIVY